MHLSTLKSVLRVLAVRACVGLDSRGVLFAFVVCARAQLAVVVAAAAVAWAACGKD
jgi:hypothetical protein